MGGFSYNNIIDLIDDNYKIAIESGTFLGHGTSELYEHFEKVYTIEIDEPLFNITRERFRDNKNIICLHGDSKEVLPKLADDRDIRDNKIVFWLDAHWSGDDSVDWGRSKWKGYNINTGYIGEKKEGVIPSINQIPLEQEIYEIYNNFRNECVIYIDDFYKIDPSTLKGLKNEAFIGEDYSHLDFNKIFNSINDRIIYKKLIDNNQCIIKFKSLDD